jgi:hypothetical protein
VLGGQPSSRYNIGGGHEATKGVRATPWLKTRRHGGGVDGWRFRAHRQRQEDAKGGNEEGSNVFGWYVAGVHADSQVTRVPLKYPTL